MVKKQYEALSTWRKKEQEKFERTKALITALREENQEHQVNLMAKADKEVTREENRVWLWSFQIYT